MSLFCFAFAKNDQFFVLAMSQGIACAIVAAQKIYFQQPRPYFIDTQIPIDCHYIDYGAPSAHTLLGIVNYGVAWVILMRGIKASSFTRNLTFWLLLAPTIIYIPLSRVYVGNHTYDQVVVGFAQGVLILLLVTVSLDHDIRHWFKNLHKHSAFSILLHPIALFIIGTNALMFYIQSQHTQPIPQLWIDNIESRCGTMEESKKNPDRASIELCILAIGSLGHVFGARFEQTVLKSHIYKKWNQTSALTRVIRTIVSSVTLLLAFVVSSTLFSKIFTPLIG